MNSLSFLPYTTFPWLPTLCSTYNINSVALDKLKNTVQVKCREKFNKKKLINFELQQNSSAAITSKRNEIPYQQIDHLRFVKK